MDNIPSKDQLVIDELVEFWQTNTEPRELFDHIRYVQRLGCNSITFFLLTVRDDLCKDKRSKYAASSASEFRQSFEVEYRRLFKPCAERYKTQAQARAEAERLEQEKTKEREERQRRVRADFEALGRQMSKATSRAVLVELGRKRQELAQYTGDEYIYEKWCWNCHVDISSAIHARCPYCRWYICGNCGSCDPDCNKTYMYIAHNGADDSYLPDFPDE